MPVEEEMNGAKNKKRSRGSVDNGSRLSALVKDKRPSARADWGGCNPVWMQAVVVNATRLGGAALFGVSRDAGAHSLKLYLDGSHETLWFNGDADLDEELEKVCAFLETLF